MEVQRLCWIVLRNSGLRVRVHHAVNRETPPGTAPLAAGRRIVRDVGDLLSTRKKLFLPSRLPLSAPFISPDSMKTALNPTGTWTKVFTRLGLL